MISQRRNFPCPRKGEIGERYIYLTFCQIKSLDKSTWNDDLGRGLSKNTLTSKFHYICTIHFKSNHLTLLLYLYNQWFVCTKIVFETCKNKIRALIKGGGLNSKGMVGKGYKKLQTRRVKNRKYNTNKTLDFGKQVDW